MKRDFFKLLMVYVNHDSISYRNSIKKEVIDKLHYYAEIYIKLHHLFNEPIWIGYNHAIKDVSIKNDNICLIMSNNDIFYLPISFFDDDNETQLTMYLMNLDLKRRVNEIIRQKNNIRIAEQEIIKQEKKIEEYQNVLNTIMVNS